jgi:predicted DNA-binding transcriptional regulator AlpA
VTDDADLPLIAKDAAAAVGLSVPAFWRAVAEGRLPQPVYPLPRAPRWFRSELRIALEQHRMLPAAAKESRRIRRLARE